MANSVLSNKALAPASIITAAGDAALSPASKVLAQDEIQTDPISLGTHTAKKVAWPKLDKNTVITRLKELKGNANLFYQGKIGLCTAAAFYHHIIQKDSNEFDSFSTELYTTGQAFLGKFKIAPDYELRHTDYTALASKPSEVPMPPQADWMLMCSLRDSENWFFDFDGSPDDVKDMETSTEEMSNWYKKTGLYSSVEYSAETGLDKIQMIQKTDKNHIALWIASKLLGSKKNSTHMITLESPITIDYVGNQLSFDYWTWGQPVQTLKTTVQEFMTHYLGVITATF